MPTVVTKTIKPAGGGDYTTLAAWATARLGVALVDTIERAECYGGNCGGVTIPAATTTDATSRVEIVAAAPARHAGGWDATKARVQSASDVMISLPQRAGQPGSYVIDGLLLGADSYYDQTCVLDGYGRAIVSGCVCDGRGYSARRGVVAAHAVRNCIFYNMRPAGSVAVSAVSGGAVDSVTVDGCRTGVMANGATVRNCTAQGCIDGFYGVFDAASDYNISDIAGDAPGAHSKTGVVQFVDAANNDYHLSSADTVARGAGVNLTASGITTDIDGDARPATGAWDIGADQVAESPTPTPGGGGYGGSPFGASPFGASAYSGTRFN